MSDYHRVGPLNRWAKVPDKSAALAPVREAARVALDRRLTAEIDPNGELTPEQLAPLLAERRRAHFAEMGQRSVAARRARKQAAAQAQEPPAVDDRHTAVAELLGIPPAKLGAALRLLDMQAS